MIQLPSVDGVHAQVFIRHAQAFSGRPLDFASAQVRRSEYRGQLLRI
jgi:hypothetical protein